MELLLQFLPGLFGDLSLHNKVRDYIKLLWYHILQNLLRLLQICVKIVYLFTSRQKRLKCVCTNGCNFLH